MPLYPLFLKLDGRRCVVVGGGTVAARKVRALLECGARVTVVSPEIRAELEKCAEANEIKIVHRAFEPGDLEGAAIAIAATNDRKVNEAVANAGRERGVLVNVVDVPGLCDFYVPSRVDRGDLQIAICTGGAFPAFAKRLRLALEKQFGPEFAAYLELLARYRQEAKARIADPHQRAKAEEAFLDSPAFALVAEGKYEEAEKALSACLARLSNKDKQDIGDEEESCPS